MTTRRTLFFQSKQNSGRNHAHEDVENLSESNNDSGNNETKEFDLSINSSLICLHAFSSTGDPDPCVFMQLTTLIEDEDNELNEDVIIVNPQHENRSSPVELFVTPLSTFKQSTLSTPGDFTQDELLKKLFDALSETAELNPPNDEDDQYFGNDDGHDVMFPNCNDDILGRLDDMLVLPPHIVEGQFQDASEDEDEGLI